MNTTSDDIFFPVKGSRECLVLHVALVLDEYD